MILFFDKIINSAKLAWKGEERLWKVFWLWGPSLVALFFITTFIKNLLIVFAEGNFVTYSVKTITTYFILNFYVFLHMEGLYNNVHNQSILNKTLSSLVRFLIFITYIFYNIAAFLVFVIGEALGRSGLPDINYKSINFNTSIEIYLIINLILFVLFTFLTILKSSNDK